MKTFIAIIIASSCISIFSQWQPDVRLTNDPGLSYMSQPGEHCIASSGIVLHVAWHDNRSGNWDIYYIRSSDAGLSWSSETRMTTNSSESHHATVTCTGLVVFIFWEDNRDGNDEIYYRRSTDGGLSWSTETRFTNDPGVSGGATVQISGLVVNAIWCDNRDGNNEIYYKRSTDAGITWGSDTRLTNNSAYSGYPSVSVSGSAVHVVWYDDRDGNNEIYYKRSTDAGITWGADTRMTNTPFSTEQKLTCNAASGSVVHIVWQDWRDGNHEIYYKRSLDAGTTWGTDTRLTNNSASSAAPNVTVSGSNLHLTWQDNRDGNIEIYYKRSPDLGISWGTDTRLTNSSGNSVRSFSTVTGTAFHVVWMDESPGNWEIYYKTDPTGNPVPIPSPPVLISPVNNTTGLLLTDTLVWNASSGAASYRLQVATDAGFSALIVNDSTLTNTSRIVSGLSQLTTYYWRVNAKNSGGTSGWSSVWNFRTKGIPTIVTLLLPPNNAANIPTTYTFRWSKAYDQTAHLFVSNYWFELVTDTVSMANLLRDSTLTDTSRVVTGMSNNTSYFWRVKAKNEIGWSNFAAWFKFTTVLIAPAAPALSAPPNGSYNQSITVRFTWNKSLYGVTYRLQVALDSQFTNLAVNDSTIADSTLLVINLTVNKYYWWRVNAKNTVGTSPYSNVWKFGTFLVGLNQLSSEIPKEFKLFNNYPNPFNPVTKIKFDIPLLRGVDAEGGRGELTSLTIYDILGREVDAFVNQQLQPGTYEVEWDAGNNPSGVYFYRLDAGAFTETRKMLLIK